MSIVMQKSSFFEATVTVLGNAIVLRETIFERVCLTNTTFQKNYPEAAGTGDHRFSIKKSYDILLEWSGGHQGGKNRFATRNHSKIFWAGPFGQL